MSQIYIIMTGNIIILNFNIQYNKIQENLLYQMSPSCYYMHIGEMIVQSDITIFAWNYYYSLVVG